MAKVKKTRSSSFLHLPTGEACSEGETLGFFPRRPPTCTRNSWGATCPSYIPCTSGGEDDVVGASQLRSHCQYKKHGGESSSCSSCTHSHVNRTCLCTKGKCLHCLHCFLSFKRRGEMVGIDTGQWKSLPGLHHLPEDGTEAVPALSRCPGTLHPAWHAAG